MKLRARRHLKVVLLLAVLLTASACIFMPDFAGQYKAGKYDPASESQTPNATASTPVAETQTAGHTCGWHAMRSLYDAYGLSPDRHDLRFRLGTDQPAIRTDKDSAGTLHPDLYRVLAQDGFTIIPMALDTAEASAALTQHLAGKQLALAVVYRGTYHWVLLGPTDDADHADQVVVYDSLQSEPQAVPVEVLVAEALSITLVSPNAGEPMSTTDAHAMGLSEMASVLQRQE